MKLNSFYVVPANTFFYWGFNVLTKEQDKYIKHFKLRKGKQTREIKLLINNKTYDAYIRFTKLNKPPREVVQIHYENKPMTKKKLRQLFIYSYAVTINKQKPKIKELMELVHIKDNIFKVKVFAKQETEFDDMLNYLEEKDLFEFWKDKDKKEKRKSFFIHYSKNWIPAKDWAKYKNIPNAIYLQCNSKKDQLYVGKADTLGSRVRKGHGKVGLDKDWDYFMYFQLDPKYQEFSFQIESFVINTFGSILPNDVGIKPVKENKKLRLVNRTKRKKL